jgi:exosome complex exonuclease DIS3/RRP44
VIAKGKVVCIWKRNSKDFCGSVEESADSVAGDGWNIVQFKPVDDKFPSFYLRTYNLAGLREKRIVVALDEWPINSKYPMGHFRKVLGDIGDPKVEGDVILLEHNV